MRVGKNKRASVDWDSLRALANTYLTSQGEVGERFRVAVGQLLRGRWEKMREAIPVADRTRRPNVSLRLIADGQPAAKLIVLPRWVRSSNAVDFDRLDLELFTEAPYPGREGVKLTRQASVVLNPPDSLVRSISGGVFPDVFHTGLIRPSVMGDLQRVLGVMADFLADGRALLARSHGHCSLCGRALTDEVSRARGVGPECANTIDSVLLERKATGNILIVPELPPTPAAPAGCGASDADQE
jgi:hypothetical protein